MLGFISLLVRESNGVVVPAVLRGVTAVIASAVVVLISHSTGVEAACTDGFVSKQTAIQYSTKPQYHTKLLHISSVHVVQLFSIKHQYQQLHETSAA